MRLQSGKWRAGEEAAQQGLAAVGRSAGLGNERLEGSMTRALTIRCAWMALAPAAEGLIR
jgi:hypothetical protein